MSKNYKNQLHQDLPEQATYWSKLPTPNRMYLDWMLENDEEQVIKGFQGFVEKMDECRIDIQPTNS